MVDDAKVKVSKQNYEMDKSKSAKKVDENYRKWMNLIANVSREEIIFISGINLKVSLIGYFNRVTIYLVEALWEMNVM